MNFFKKTILQPSRRTTRIFILLLSCFFFLGTENVQASHLAGGEINYECLGNNQYRISLILYQDCAGASMQMSESLNISSTNCGLTLPSLNMPLDTSYEVSSCPLNTNCNGGQNPGIRKYVYTNILIFPQACTDWILSWSDCCRNIGITNLVSNQASFYIEAGINSTICNSSPVFSTQRINYFCAGQCYEYNNGGYDPDGDSLLYALTCPLEGVNNCLSNVAGLSTTQPIWTNSATTFDLNQNTGQMSFCTAIGQAQLGVVTMTVYEISNGDTIGYVQREMQLNVLNNVNCSTPVISTTPDVLAGGTFDSLNQSFEVCAGQTLIFETIVYDPKGLAVGVDAFNLNLDAVFGVGNAQLFLNSSSPYRPDSVQIFVQINTINQRIGTNTFTISFTDNACPNPSIETKAYQLNVLGVEASITTTGTTMATYCPEIALSIPLETNVNSTGTYMWTQTTGPTITFSNNTDANPTLFLPNTTQDGDSIVVQVSYTTGTCTSTDEITILTQVSPINLNVLASDTTLCPNGMADTIAFSILADNSRINTSNGVYTWSATPTGFLSNLMNTTTNAPSAILNTVANDTITYKVRYDYGLCADSVEITLSTRAGAVMATTNLDSICVGDTVQLMAVLTDTMFVLDTTACYNYSVGSIPFAPIAGSGTTVPLADDALSVALPIGFDFEFYCTTYSQFVISSNGFITFDTIGSINGCCSGQVLPNSAIPNNLIALGWTDLVPNNAGGAIDYFTIGTAPNRQLIVNFINTPRVGGANPITAQIILHEGTNAIDIHSSNVPSAGQTTQGIENADGTLGLAIPGRNSGIWSATNDAYRFSPSPTYIFGPITYDWMPNTTVSDATIYNPTANPLETTTYKASIDEGGCIRTDSVEIFINTTINAPTLSCGFANVPTSSVLFEWGQASGAIAWEYSLDSAVTWTTSLFNDSSFLYTGLQQGTCYGIWVRAIGGIGGCTNNAATYLDCCTNVLSNVVTQNGITLSAVAVGPSITYQWIDCNNGNVPITGATGQSFTATTNGDYAVRIEDGLNTVLSTCNTINVTEITTLEDNLGILCYPNPTTGLLQIKRKDTELLDIQVVDYLGRILLTKKTNKTQLDLDLGAYPTGIYTIQFKNATKSISQKVVKQ